VAAPAAARGWAFPSALAGTILLAAALAAFTWGKWGDAVIDVGREMEVPWKIAEGQVLYRDIAYNYGPLSPYLNALALSVLGVRLGTLVFVGFVGAGLGAVLVWLLARRFVGRIGALALVSVFLFECVFQHYFWNGSFNFILPYSFPAVHAVLLALGAMLALRRHCEQGSLGALALAGVLGGLAALAKVEIAAAAAGALAAATLLFRTRIFSEPARAIRATLVWSIPALGVAAAGYLPFVLASSWERVVRENVFKPTLVDARTNVFFLRQLGLEHPGASLGALAASAAFWGGAIALLALAARVGTRARGPGRGRGSRATAALLAGAVLVAGWFLLPFDTVYRALPLAAAVVVAVAGVRALRRARGESGGGTPGSDAFAAAFGVLALLALARIVLNAGTYQYGFFMALPALLLLGILGAALVPRWLGFEPRTARLHAALVLLLLLVVGARDFLVASAPKYRAKTLAIEGRRGTMYAFPWRPRYEAIAIAIRHLETHHPDANETLVVIPEGAAINFLTGRRNPTSFDLFLPPELAAPGAEDRLVAELRATKPDTILLIDRSVEEYGFAGPGIDYALALMRFVEANYTVEAKIGPRPFATRGKEGGALVYRRRAP